MFLCLNWTRDSSRSVHAASSLCCRSSRAQPHSNCLHIQRQLTMPMKTNSYVAYMPFVYFGAFKPGLRLLAPLAACLQRLMPLCQQLPHPVALPEPCTQRTTRFPRSTYKPTLTHQAQLIS